MTPARSAYTTGGYPVIKVANITQDWRVDWKHVAFTSESFFNRAKKGHVQDGDFLILSASHQLDYIGRNFGLVRDVPTQYADRCMTVGELIIARAKPKMLWPEYLLACFMMTPIQELVNRMTRGQSAHLYSRDLRELRIPTPPLAVQKEIGGELSRRRNLAQELRAEAEIAVVEAKARVERMILGREEVESG